MSKTIIFDTEATGIKEPVLIEAAWVELESIKPFTVTNYLINIRAYYQKMFLATTNSDYLLKEILMPI